MTATGTGNGSDFVRVTLTNACGSQRVIRVPVVVGVPQPGTINWTWNAPPNRVGLDVDDVPNATSYKWYLNGVLKATTTNSYYNLPINGNVTCGNFYYFGVRSVNDCGESAESYIGADMPPCDFAYRVSPNPGSDNIKIESVNVGEKANSKYAAEIQEIEIYDKMGIIKQKQKFIKGLNSVNISVAALPSDVYTLRIFDGQIWHSCKIVVHH